MEEKLRSISGFEDQLITARRYLHQHPEIGFNEFETSRFIRNTLESHGLTVHGPLAKTGLYVDIEGHLPGPHIGYRADIDALPTQDAKHVSYASKNAGVAHLCGHDVHSTIAIGIALLLKENREAFGGTIRVFFQPNEEGKPSGAPVMIEDGVLDGLEAVYACHVDPTLPTGQFGLIKGTATASAVRFSV
ncbi:MAG: amidohydrolase, partial [Rhodothermaceae bacterium]|nr:amidohydrolase [Rhodothermaceae bacterium]